MWDLIFLQRLREIIVSKRREIYLVSFLSYIALFWMEIVNLSYRDFSPKESMSVAMFVVRLLKYLFDNRLVLHFGLILLVIILYFIFVYFLSKIVIRIMDKFSAGSSSSLAFLKSDYFIVVFLLIFSGIIRFGFLNAGLFHHDSFQTAIAVEKTLEEGRLYAIGGGRQGIVIADSIIFFIFKNLFGHTSAEFAVNFGSALFGTLSIPILYFFVKNLSENRFIAFSSGILYSVTPIFLSVSTFAKEHTLDAFIVLLSLLFLVLGLKKSNYSLIFISGFIISLAIFVRFPSILIVASALFLIFGFYREKNAGMIDGIKKSLAYIFPIIIVLGLYILFGAEMLSNEAKSNFVLSSEALTIYLPSGLVSGFDALVISLTGLGLLFSLAGLIFLFMKNRRLFYFVLLFSIPLFVFYAFSKTVSHRFFVVPLIAFIIALCYFIRIIYSKEPYAGVLILLLLVIVLFFSIYPVIKFRHEFSAFKELAEMINGNTNPADSVVILYGDDTIALNYYSKTPTRSCDYNPDAQSVGKFASETKKLLAQNYKVYISGACFGLGKQQEQKVFLDIMSASFKGSMVAEYTSDDYHLGAVKPVIKRISMIKLYDKSSQKGINLDSLPINY